MKNQVSLQRILAEQKLQLMRQNFHRRRKTRITIFQFRWKKTAENVYAGAFSLGDGTTYSFETQTNDKIEKIDVIGFKMPTNSGAATIKNLAIAVAPEPAMFGLLAGTLALVLAGTRRRRR